MLRQRRMFVNKCNIFLIGVIIVIAYSATYVAVKVSDPHINILPPFRDMLGLNILFAFFVGVSLRARRFNVFDDLGNASKVARDLFWSYFQGSFGFFTLIYVVKIPHMSRFYMIGGGAISFACVLLSQIIIMNIRKRNRSKSDEHTNVLLIGEMDELDQVINTIENNKQMNLRVAGIMGLKNNKKVISKKYNHWGGVKNLSTMHKDEVIDCAIFTNYQDNPALVESAILECVDRGIEVWFKPDFLNRQAASSRVDYLDDMPLVVLSMGPKFGYSLVIKRIIEYMASIILIILLAIPMIVIAILIKTTSKGPVLFKQNRMGLNGRSFVMYKFRSMHADARPLTKKELAQNTMTGPVFKLENDPRMTPLGVYLRKFSLDELPQLFNVLIGSMNLIGPRPPLATEVGQYKGWQRRRLSMRPGITGLWQVMGRNKICDFDEWTELDLKYIDEWNLYLDFKIALKTIPTILKGTGY